MPETVAEAEQAGAVVPRAQGAVLVEIGDVVQLHAEAALGALDDVAGGLLKPDAGRVELRGEAGPACLNALTYVFQDFALLPWRSVAGNVALVLEGTRLSKAERRVRVAEVLATTGLTALAGAWPRQLSGGMRQRVGIARALAVRPAVLLMDEPLSALDAQTRELLLDEFASLIAAEGMTVIYVTHNLAEAVRLGHQVVVLSRRPGRVREILRIDQPLTTRRADDPALLATEARLWALIRADAAEAAMELEHG